MGAKAWRSAAAGLMVLAAGLAAAAQDDTYQSTTRSANGRATTAIRVDDSWWPFARSERRQAQAAVEARHGGKPGEAPAGEFRSMTPREVAALVNQARDVYLRRLGVCDRIRQIAEETGDAALEAQAELLQQRAMILFQQRVTQLRLPGVLPESTSAAAATLTQEARPRRAATARADAAPIRSIRGEQASGGNGGGEKE
jgi:hypothetical protein